MPSSIDSAFERFLADTDQPSFSQSRSPSQPTRERGPSHHPMSIANLASPNPIRVENQPSIPSFPDPTASPKGTPRSQGVLATNSQNRLSQRSEDVTMDETVEEVEFDDVGDTTERIDEEDGEDEEEGEEGEDGEADEDDEDSEDDDDDEESDDDEDDDIDVTHVIQGSGETTTQLHPVKTEPGEPTVPGEAGISVEGEEVNTLVPKKKSRKKREASVDDLPAAPPPMVTIRLEYKLRPEGEDSEWNVLEAAQEAGLVPRWAPIEEDKAVEPMDTDEPQASREAPGILMSLDGDAEEIARRLEEKYDKPTKKRPIKKKVKDVYDFTDDFIDDSEIAIDDAETHVPRPVKEGFFVHAGQVELMSATQNKAVKRPQAKKARLGVAGGGDDEPLPSLASATTSRLRAQRRQLGSVNDPVSIDDDDDTPRNAVAGPSSSPMSPIKSSSPIREIIPLIPVTIDRVKYHAAVRDPKYLPPFPIFPPEVQQGLLQLRQASEKSRKSPFPVALKADVRAAGKVCFENEMLSERDEDRKQGLFTALCSCLPYNATTLRKLFYRLCQQDYWDFLQHCEDTGIQRMMKLVQLEQDKWIKKFDEAMETYKSQLSANGDEPSATNTPPVQVDGEEDGQSGALAGLVPAKLAPLEPKKQSVWTQEMKENFGQLVDNYQDMADLNRQLLTLELQNNHSDRDYTEANMKSRLYKRVIDVFPEGYTNPTQVSRYSSATRKKDKKPQGEL